MHLSNIIRIFIFMKTSKIYKESFNSLKVEYGVINTTHQATFISFGIWVEPLINTPESNPQDLSKKLNKLIRQEAFNLGVDIWPMAILPNKTVTTSDIIEHKLVNTSLNKYTPSFINVEIHMFFNGSVNVMSKEMKEQHRDFIKRILNTLKSNKWLSISPTKKINSPQNEGVIV